LQKVRSTNQDGAAGRFELPIRERFWFHAGQLSLAYGDGSDCGVLFLARER